jgi:hypothetical protein
LKVATIDCFRSVVADRPDPEGPDVRATRLDIDCVGLFVSQIDWPDAGSSWIA